MKFPQKMSFRSRLALLPLALAVGISFSSPASAAAWTQPEYLYRYFVWGAQFAFSSRSDDYRRYGYHTIDKAPTAFQFTPGKRDLVPETVEYDDGEGVKRVALSELLQSTGTHAFIVLRDNQVLYENYFNGFARDSLMHLHGPCQSPSPQPWWGSRSPRVISRVSTIQLRITCPS